MNIFKGVLLFACVVFSGCTHISDLLACQHPVQSPELFSDHVGWDNRSVDDVRCTNEELQSARHARQNREADSVVQ